MFTIYRIINNINHHCYIGFTTKYDHKQRLYGHYKATKHGSMGVFHQALRKYGRDNFSFEILEVGENTDYGLSIAEPMYIAWLKPEYNMTRGGEGTWGWKPSEETKNKLRIAATGKTASLETRYKMSVKRKGTPKPHRSESHRRNQSLAHMGQIPCNKGKTGLQVAWNKGKAQPKIECPSCHQIGGPPGIYRWHFSNCKEKV